MTIALILAASIHSAVGAAEHASLHDALESIQPSQLQAHVDVLADDSFEGREAGSRGGRAAGGYLVRHLAKSRLRPAGDGNSWFQPFAGGYRNVLGILEGGDPELKQQLVVVSAHYDHVGYGSPRNSYGPTGYIHNGADDNASGTSLLLELVEAAGFTQVAPRRSILFAFWDGEEKGLLGSRHWISSPTRPIDKVVAAVNVDMVGRLRKQLQIGGTRTAWGMRRPVSRFATDAGVAIDFTWDYRRNSDHWPFYEKRIPSFFIHTGLHEDYHRPSDDTEKINHEGMAKVGRLALSLIWYLADTKEISTFRGTFAQEKRRGRGTLERVLPPLPTRLGIWWSEAPASSDRGLLITRLVQGSPAERAGIRLGDRLVALDGESIRDGDELRAHLLAADRVVHLTLDRDSESEPIALDIELDGQPVRVGFSWRHDEAEPNSVFLTRVVPGSPAASADLRVLDRIYDANGQPVGSTAWLLNTIRSSENELELLVERQGRLRNVRLRLPPGQEESLETSP